MSNHEKMSKILIDMKKSLEERWNIVTEEGRVKEGICESFVMDTITNYMTIVDLLSKYTHHFEED